MKKTVSKLASLLLMIPVLPVLVLFTTPAFAAQCPDLDGDGYITLSTETAALVLGDTFLPDGNHGKAEWENFYDTYKAELELTPDADCDNISFKKGAEPVRCDARLVDASSGVFDSSKVPSVSGNKVYPGAYDIPNNGIDEDCDGGDGAFLADGGAGANKDLGGLVQRAISMLGKVVVTISIVIMIWGGILYATAAGDEQKTSKARKAIIGAIIGLLVGLLAPAVINWLAGALG